MKKSINYLVIAVLAILSVSCSSEASLQKYYIDSQENKNFLSIDIPASIISLKDEVSPEAIEAYNSLRKMNLLAFKKNATNEVDYTKESNKVKAILKNNKFKELMRMKDKGRDIVIKYEGDDNSMDEVIVYASDKTQGFALVRILGDNMKPEKIMKLVGDVQSIDGGDSMIKQLEGFMKEKS